MNNLNYEILFIENDPNFVNSIILQINKFLEEQGFKPKIIQKKGKDLDTTEINESTDLILLDLNLDKSFQGSDLIPKIREHDISADILFYSDDILGFNKKLKTLGNLDGVYFYKGRKDIGTKIKKLILKSIKKHQTVSNLRGLVISEAIDLEAKMSKIIIKFFGLLEHPREELFYEGMLDPEVFMLGKKSDLMNSICKQLKYELSEKIKGRKIDECKSENELITMLGEIHKECAKTKKEVVEIRNILSHVEQSKEDPNILESTIKRYNKIRINSDWCIKTRKDLIKHSLNLDKLYKNII